MWENEVDVFEGYCKHLHDKMQTYLQALMTVLCRWRWISASSWFQRRSCSTPRMFRPRSWICWIRPASSWEMDLRFFLRLFQAFSGRTHFIQILRCKSRSKNFRFKCLNRLFWSENPNFSGFSVSSAHLSNSFRAISNSQTVLNPCTSSDRNWVSWLSWTENCRTGTYSNWLPASSWSYPTHEELF